MSFNEAAGYPAEDNGGRATGRLHAPASMRPRVIPAEDRNRAQENDRRGPSFNEAAGYPAEDVLVVRQPDRDRAASMRPRGYPRGRHLVAASEGFGLALLQ